MKESRTTTPAFLFVCFNFNMMNEQKNDLCLGYGQQAIEKIKKSFGGTSLPIREVMVSDYYNKSRTSKSTLIKPKGLSYNRWNNLLESAKFYIKDFDQRSDFRFK